MRTTQQSRVTEKSQKLLNVARSSLVLLVTTDHYHSANPMELIGASVLRWPTRLRTDARRETMLMSEGYLANGKTILCRASEADRYKSLADIDKPEVTVMVNPGGLNEKFANEKLTHAKIVVHPKNEEIPTLVAEGAADLMITEITEAPYYVKTDTRLAAPLLNAPFTHGEIGVLMQKGQEDLLQMVNNIIRQMKSDGTLRKLHEKYGLIYAYN